MEVHGTVHGTSTVHLPSYVKNHGILSGRDLQFLLRETKVGPGSFKLSHMKNLNQQGNNISSLTAVKDKPSPMFPPCAFLRWSMWLSESWGLDHSHTWFYVHGGCETCPELPCNIISKRPLLVNDLWKWNEPFFLNFVFTNWKRMLLTLKLYQRLCSYKTFILIDDSSSAAVLLKYTFY